LSAELRRHVVSALAFGLAVAVATAVVILGVARLVAGPEWALGGWELANQLALAQVIGMEVGLFGAGAAGWFAFAQFVEDRQARDEQRLAERERLINALESLEASLEHNRDQLHALATDLLPRMAP
jgi:hypothetical protein